jgi:hypothetical protein
LLLQPANFRQQSDKQAYLLKNQRRFAVVSRVKMRNALSQFIQRLFNAGLICRPVMKRVIDIADGVIEQVENTRVGEFLTVGTQRRNIAGERMVQAEQAERGLTDLRRGARLR